VRDRGGVIATCINSVLTCDYPSDRFEVVVVDNASSDGTADVRQRYGTQIRAVYEAKRGPAAARGGHDEAENAVANGGSRWETRSSPLTPPLRLNGRDPRRARSGVRPLILRFWEVAVWRWRGQQAARADQREEIGRVSGERRLLLAVLLDAFEIV